MRETIHGPGETVAAQTPAQSVTDGLNALSYPQLRARLNELQQQRQTVASRREALAGQYEDATGANQEGIAARLTVMDKTIVGMEGDIAVVARAMAIKAPITSEPPPGVGQHWQDDEVAGLGFSVFFGTLLVTAFFMRRWARRRWKIGPPGATGTPQSNERLDRIEHAVDAIAIEIERVSENQRFMTRLMTETQLAGSLAAVRSSAGAAKEAAG